jgi:hypothetical protein
VLLETLAHDVFFKYDNPDNRRVSAGSLRLDGSMTFVDGRPAVFVEAEGHGVTSASRAVAGSVGLFPGIVYRYTGTRRCPRAIAIPKLLLRSRVVSRTPCGRGVFDVGELFCCAEPYVMADGPNGERGSAFNGPYRRLRRQAAMGMGPGERQESPWATGSAIRSRPIPRKCGSKTSAAHYVHNPYLQSDGRSASQPCAQSATCKTVKGALVESLLGIGRANHRSRL